jgi:hypothetical protein
MRTGLICQHCGTPLGGRATKWCSPRCRNADYEARGARQREAVLGDERAAEVADARGRLAELHARREVLAGDADDSLVGSELTSVSSQIRAAEALLRERDGGVAGGAS